MNPAHTSDKPGPAPCGMPMEPVYADDDASGVSLHPTTPGAAKITPEKQQVIGIRVEAAQVTSREHFLRALGRVFADENLTYRMVAGAEGWVWDVYESTTDSLVQKDQLMASIYNNQFLARQQQFLFAVDFAERAQHASVQAQRPLQPGERRELGPLPADDMALPVPTAPSGLNPTGNVYYVENQVELAKLELYNLGVGDYQIKELARTKQITSKLELRSPVTGIVIARNVSPMQKFDKNAELFRVADLSRVWVMVDIFENEASHIRPGMAARVSLPRQQKTFDAVVTEVPPRFDLATRTLKVRLDVANPALELRPDMFVDVELRIALSPSINVPVDALLDSGLTRTVFVDLGNGYFEPRTVKTGWRFGDRIEITEGLNPGENVVVSGNFLIDSESRMKLAAAGLFGSSVKDPVCGMVVYTGSARAAELKAERDGKTQYFCSRQCLEIFNNGHTHHEASPETSAPEPSSPHERPREPPGMPGNVPAVSASSPGIPGDGNGMEKHGYTKCPICGMIVHIEQASAVGLKIDHGSKKYFFCSGQCKDQFSRAPEQYARRAARWDSLGHAPEKRGEMP